MSASALAVFVLLNGMYQYVPIGNGSDIVSQPDNFRKYCVNRQEFALDKR